MPKRATPWRVPRIFELYPLLLANPPTVRTDRNGFMNIKWTNGDRHGPTSIVLICVATGPYLWDYTIDDDLGPFLRHHHGPHGDPDRDPFDLVARELGEP
jgi:hypothetical protein